MAARVCNMQRKWRESGVSKTRRRRMRGIECGGEMEEVSSAKRPKSTWRRAFWWGAISRWSSGEGRDRKRPLSNERRPEASRESRCRSTARSRSGRMGWERNSATPTLRGAACKRLSSRFVADSAVLGCKTSGCVVMSKRIRSKVSIGNEEEKEEEDARFGFASIVGVEEEIGLGEEEDC